MGDGFFSDLRGELPRLDPEGLADSASRPSKDYLARFSCLGRMGTGAGQAVVMGG